MNNKRSLWFACHKRQISPKIRLFCFPYAGGGSAVYREWNKFLSPDIEIFSVLMPGREQRFSEQPFHSLEELIHSLMESIQPYLDIPFAFFGHSMGALIAFELAREIYSEWGISPVHLFVSGKSAPQTIQDQPPIYNLPRDKFLEKLQDLNGTPNEVLQNQDLIDLYETMLRADFEICDTYRYIPGPPLNCPISIFGGLQDTVTKERLCAWRSLTTSLCAVCMYEGDHFFIYKQRENLLQVIQEELLLSFSRNQFALK
jgi:medium-chain acyl-[acyl-carrier-protein] hydrolase